MQSGQKKRVQKLACEDEDHLAEAVIHAAPNRWALGGLTAEFQRQSIHDLGERRKTSGLELAGKNRLAFN
eukprot:TRINITY_DN4211_c0_g1_i1.p2 TRINITY_DN4211_c0_g1~~TRINITY_DN4211_c0_g1_i1.p2  ORF type:complete len:70 (+),score=10.02 TRINITY_DN4211_c0_g1_i1:105-314(+)